MRKIVVSQFMTLDGIADEPIWTGPYWLEEMDRFKQDELYASDAILLGRVTYELFAATWPTDTDPMAPRLNTLPKYVPSTTLETAEWNNTHLIKGNVVEEITRLKQQPGQDIIVYGSNTLIDTLLQADLIDELRLMVFPLVKGEGKRMFQEGRAATLKLVDTRVFNSGVIALIYQPDRKKAE